MKWLCGKKGKHIGSVDPKSNIVNLKTQNHKKVENAGSDYFRALGIKRQQFLRYVLF